MERLEAGKPIGLNCCAVRISEVDRCCRADWGRFLPGSPATRVRLGGSSNSSFWARRFVLPTSHRERLECAPLTSVANARPKGREKAFHAPAGF